MNHYNKKRSLVFIASLPFGYHTDTYYYCKYLKSKYDITYISWDNEFKQVAEDEIRIVNVNRHGGLLRFFRMLKVAWKETKQKDTIIFINYSKFVPLILHLARIRNPFILDIRTASVAKSKRKRVVDDFILKFETRFFRNITIVSKGLAEKLALKEKAKILPLGADVASNNDKKFDGLHLLYVGTLYNRDLDKVIEGVSQYHDKYKDKNPDISLTIVGDSDDGETTLLQQQIIQYRLEDRIKLTGWIPHNQLKKYFDSHNVGISFIPMTDYFDVQPPTKTFEYLLSGMPVIATNTTENARVINQQNGVLINDTAEDVCKGIEEIKRNFDNYSSTEIREQSESYSWNHIIKDLDGYLEKTV